jgi:RHS repeat-associated protein
MQMPGRNGGEDYRYAFNGMEHDPEVSGDGNSYTTEFRAYDPRLGRWKSLDPLMDQFPHQSGYVAFDNNPIYFVDPRGASATGGGLEEAAKSASAGAVSTSMDDAVTKHPYAGNSSVVAGGLKLKKTGENQYSISGNIHLNADWVNISKKEDYLIDGGAIQSGADIFARNLNAFAGAVTNFMGQHSVDNGVLSIIPSSNISITWDATVSVSVSQTYDLSRAISPLLIAIVDDAGRARGGQAAGRTIKGSAGIGRVVFLRADHMGTGNLAKRTIAHELGHVFGLGHWWNAVPGDKGPGLMNYGDVTELQLHTAEYIEFVTMIAGGHLNRFASLATSGRSLIYQSRKSALQVMHEYLNSYSGRVIKYDERKLKKLKGL